ncbi:MAG: YggS family pyridoxal phosphate-dependent enzyme [Hyphomicrobiales bacterium]|nr:YggS family pyridoxal phosphate-dependent enzyme [Hyphomicrobiales bacterium]MDE2016513.1 YggS family pyridoxal phosphate-dependent enzyme [Hyphomicrobiales bacterium]
MDAPQPEADPTQALETVRHELARALVDAGRPEGSARLCAVSKTVGQGPIRAAIAAGQRLFGENRVQEAKAKWPELRAETEAAGRGPVELHLIGPLQTNKAREAVALFDAIQTLDRERLAAALAEEIQRAGRAPRLFVQVNTGEEPQKAGVSPREADAFIARCRTGYGIEASGLMCIPPAQGQVSPHFALLAKIAARNGVKELSMGMSGDWPLAVQLGATVVRVGSAIFGARPGPAG